MAVADLDAYLSLLRNKQQLLPFAKGTSSTTLVIDSYYSSSGSAGPLPSTGVVPGRTDAGAFGQQNGGGTALRLIEASSIAEPGSVTNKGHGMFWLCDRLSHQGGLVCTVATEQTTNLPTAALTRNTDGVGVMCGLTTYVLGALGGGTVTVRYTMDGVGSKTSAEIGWSGVNNPGRFFVIPTEVGGRGFQSVEGVTATPAGGSAGNFGVTLFKPLAGIILDRPQAYNATSLNFLNGGLVIPLAEIPDDACLFMLFTPHANDNGSFGGMLHLGVE